MPKTHKPRAGSLQYWPRKRAEKIVPSVNWQPLEKKHHDKKGLLGFIGYKAGNARIIASDLTPDSLTKNKQIILPVTVLEVPSIKILSIRFYKNNNVSTEVLASDLDKELKRKIKLPKEKSRSINEIEKDIDRYDNIRVIVYTQVKKTGKKKAPDILEMGIGGTIREKFDFAKNNLEKEIAFKDFFPSNQLIDTRAVTKGFGLTGPVARMGIALKSHKSEKGQRRPGNLAPWHPSRVTFRAPLAGQSGFFTRVQSNIKILDQGQGNKLSLIFPHYGKIETDYVLLKGSVQGPAKRAIVLTSPLRETKKTKKKNLEVIKIIE
ncbi:MAG: 50S ribosomal protein L3 [Candidatus Pacearchaeota archaeon]|nr:50S ribosomal protein L3 [Candidatus Pacearchaeota archaeon]